VWGAGVVRKKCVAQGVGVSEAFRPSSSLEEQGQQRTLAHGENLEPELLNAIGRSKVYLYGKSAIRAPGA
jgi:hypothetical protein